LKWEVPIVGDWEIDRFDDEDPLYVLSIDATGQLNGCFRLLPTTGPNMLRDVFSKITDNCDQVENPFTWEASRFCARLSNGQDQRDIHTINKTTVELLAAMCEVGVLARLDHVVAVYDAFLRKIILRIGCNEILVGAPTVYGKVMTYAGLFEINTVWLDALKRAWQLPSQLVEAPNIDPMFVAA
jgi:acyl homoserine lactone synthase